MSIFMIANFKLSMLDVEILSFSILSYYSSPSLMVLVSIGGMFLIIHVEDGDGRHLKMKDNKIHFKMHFTFVFTEDTKALGRYFYGNSDILGELKQRCRKSSLLSQVAYP